MMKKSLKKLGLVLTIATSLVFTGCGKKDVKEIEKSMVDKYASLCTLGEYKSLTYVDYETEMIDTHVQKQIDALLEENATTTEVKSGVAENGDVVNIDYLGKVDGVAFEGGTDQGCELILGSGRMIPGFEEQIVGHSVGETFDIYVTFPEEYGAPNLAGVDAVFTITINSKIKKDYPEYTDALVFEKRGYNTIAEYEAAMLEEGTALTQEEATKNELDYYKKMEVMTKAVEGANIKDYPQKDMEKLVDDIMARETDTAKSAGYELADYVVGYYGMTIQEFEEYVANLVEDHIREKIVVCAIAKAENITVTEEEITAYKKEVMADMGITDEKEFDKQYKEEDLVYYKLNDKVAEFLVENASPVQATPTDAVQ